MVTSLDPVVDSPAVEADFQPTPKISQALRAGSVAVAGQICGCFYDRASNQACALGAIFIGAGLDPTLLDHPPEYTGAFADVFGVLAHVYPQLKQTLWIDGCSVMLYHAIMIHNDSRGWSFEKIAEWLEERLY